MDYFIVRKRPTQFLAITGLTITEFEALLVVFAQQWEAYIQSHCYNGKKRRNKRVHPSRGQLPTAAQKLFFILVYYKNNFLQQVLAACFNMDQPQAAKWIRKIELILVQSLQKKGCLPTRTPADLYDRLVAENITQVLLDGTEREVPRSTDYDTQKEHYSGKKKTHTVKNNVLTDLTDRILYLSPTYVGKTHDKAICNEEPLTFPKGTIVWQDTGFQGHAPEQAICLQPVKKPRGKERTDAQKKWNQAVAQIRVYVEHAIGGVKCLHIVKHKIRQQGMAVRDRVMVIACGLHNLRKAHRPTKKAPPFACLTI